ncbi:TDE2712 family protein [Alkaliphilus peptidifermentans]|uniref:Uncharacterized protein n=1 Tax=Alkaliphilus peptidifermentans DSM 18978 TaxID=1120976 RepID=A0A1G5KWQ3_9FIRM|nr:hypothetical protein [Alkaliphilus peptidifermentans]SCZ04548.1 hypothetical protein SAMN03080606_03800 [Alkaliphilus peptidifermentans DSM 18978]
MVKRIKTKLDVIEGMLYYWQATSEREKVGETYLNSLANQPEMNYIYDDEFNRESVRRALSAISNREIFHSENKKERIFWNNNMWMMEDLDYTKTMVAPLKTLNLDLLVEKLNSKSIDSHIEELEVIFIPGHADEYKITDDKLIINFFRVKPDLYEDDKVTIGDKPIIDYIEEKLNELIK